MTFKVEIVITEEMLGTKPRDPEVFGTYVGGLREGGLAKDEQDAAARAASALEDADQAEKTGTTIFHRNEAGQVGIFDYQIKGFLKAACAAMRQVEGSPSSKLPAFKSKISQLIFVRPRFIVCEFPMGVQIQTGICERPLMADTAQGPRVSLARSETLPAGVKFNIEIFTLADKISVKDQQKLVVRDLLEEWLQYGQLAGLGQWRNSGKGRFTYKLEPQAA